MNSTKDLLLEIGVEELPHGFILPASSQLETKAKNLFETERLKFSKITSYSTPRRLAFLVEGLESKQADIDLVKKGPLLKVAFKEGLLTQAGKGFIKNEASGEISENTLKDIDSVKDKKPGVYFRVENDQKFLVSYIFNPGVETSERLKIVLPQLISSLEFPKAMRWGAGETSFARPMRWLLALFGEKVVEFELAGIKSGNSTSGHPQFFPRQEQVRLNNPQDYLQVLQAKKVLADVKERQAAILTQLSKLEGQQRIKVLEKEKVSAIVTQLTEWPHCVLAEYDAEFLKLPREVLISEMVEHQKYFPVEDEKGKLLPAFVITANIENEKYVSKGNLKVLTARLRDGGFLYQEDLKQGLAKMGEKLEAVTYLKELGSISEKVQRTEKLAQLLAKQLELASSSSVSKIVKLMKNDLASHMVYEFPALQGVMGTYYAKADGINVEDAKAIEEHYLPLGAGGALPATELGIVLALADKLDTILGLFSIGHVPTGSQDPHALRRQALGILRILVEQKLAFSLVEFLHLPEVFGIYEAFVKKYSPSLSKAHFLKQVSDFFAVRFKSYLKDQGFSNENLSFNWRVENELPEPFTLFQKCLGLDSLEKKNNVREFYGLLSRIEKLGVLDNSKIPDHKYFSTSKIQEETALYEYYKKNHETLLQLKKENNFVKVFEFGFAFKETLDAFFKAVMVNSEVPEEKEQRQALLAHIYHLIFG